MLLWRPILRRRASLIEVRTVLTLDDLADLNELIDLEDALEADAHARAEERRPRR